MSDTAFDVRLARLRANLDEVGTMLRDHGETHWLRWVIDCQTQLDLHDSAVFDALLGAFGGMGGVNDLLILAANGHLVRPEDEAAVNDRLAYLREAIWDDGTMLRHDLRGSPERPTHSAAAT